MSYPMTQHEAVKRSLVSQAASIYENWINGNKSTAAAMLSQVPHKRTAFVAANLVMLALHDSRQYELVKFLEGSTQ